MTLVTEKGLSEQEKEAASEICRRLGGLPLAISQVASIMKRRNMSMKKFLDLYEAESARIHASGKVEIGSHYTHTIKSVWLLSFTNLSPPASRLLGVLSFLNPDNISKVFLARQAERFLRMDKFGCVAQFRRKTQC